MSWQWTFLDDADSVFNRTGVHDLGPGLPTIICDRLIAALSVDGRQELDQAAAALERFYLGRMNRAPAAAAAAAQGEDVVSSEAAAFTLGQIGLAHAIAARAASKRISDNFERLLRSPALERYVRALVGGEFSGKQIADRLEKDEAEVSRKLRILREIGAVECRREGNRVVNFLTAAAKAVVRARNMGPLSVTSKRELPGVVSSALDAQRQLLPPQMRGSLTFALGEGGGIAA